MTKVGEYRASPHIANKDPGLLQMGYGYRGVRLHEINTILSFFHLAIGVLNSIQGRRFPSSVPVPHPNERNHRKPWRPRLGLSVYMLPISVLSL